MITFLWILLGFVSLIFIFHFVSMRVVKHVRRSRKYWNDEIFKNWNIRVLKGRFELYLTPSTSIMITKSRYHKLNYDDEIRKYSHSITLEIGGLWLRYEYGHNFLTDENWSEGERTKYYGLYSIDGELFWKSIWWGTKLYDNPFRRMKHLSTCIWNMSSNEMISKRTFDKFSDEYDKDQEFPYISVLTDTTYVDKLGKSSHVKEIKFWIEEIKWTWYLFHRHILKCWAKTRCYLEFETTGIGVGKNDWKGQTTASSINITNEKELYRQYKKTRKNPSESNKRVLNVMMQNRIRNFMLIEKRF